MSNFSLKSGLEKEGLRIVKLLEQNDFKAFWVGGTVRDMLLKRKIGNLDIAASAKPTVVENLLNTSGYHTKPVGKKYGTILVVTQHGPIEITTFRAEGGYKDRRHPEEIKFIDSYEEDSKRRDFTINALYYDPIRNIILDPQNGRRDLDKKLIKFVGDPKKRIDEDALRMLRAVRFSVQLNFKLEKNCFAAIKTRAKYIQNISGERIKSELDKILVSKNKVEGIRLLDEIGLLKFIIPEIDVLKKIWHKSKLYHLEGHAFEHTMRVLENIPDGDIQLSYAALFHDAGKSKTLTPKLKAEGLVNSFPKHEFVSGDLFKNFAKRLKFSRKDTNLILWITRMHMTRVAFAKDMSEKKKIDLAMHPYFSKLILMWRADQLGKLVRHGDKIIADKPGAYIEGAKLLKNIESKNILLKKLTTGKIILENTKIKPGPHVKEIKKSLEIEIISGKIKNISHVKKYLQKNKNNT